MNYWVKDLSEIGVRIIYEDELGKKQTTLERRFDFTPESQNITNIFVGEEYSNLDIPDVIYSNWITEEPRKFPLGILGFLATRIIYRADELDGLMVSKTNMYQLIY